MTLLYSLVTEIAAGEPAESAETTNPVLPEINEIFWSALFFFLLWALMKYVLLPPIRRMQAQRNQKLQDDRDAAAKAEQDYQGAQADYDAAVASARQDANSLMDQARQRASDRRQEIVSQATAAVTAARATATTEIAAAREQAIDNLRPQLKSLAVQAATDVLGRQPSDAQQAAVDRYLAQLGGAGGGTAQQAGGN